MHEILKKYLSLGAQRNASDLHLSAGNFPILRIDGELVPLIEERQLTNQELEEIAKSILNPRQWEHFQKYLDLDFSFSLEDKLRIRGNLFVARGNLSFAFRLIPLIIPTIDELNLPPILYEFAKQKQGFILFVGPAGTGKSTSLATVIEQINHTRRAHIITIEEPIEYIFSNDLAIIHQREIPADTVDWHRALRSALREDPDVIMIGEMRDQETIATALTAAETGHLVLSTLHTNSASQTIDRIIGIFPPEQQNQIRLQLASTLVGIISQRLIPRIKGGRIPACEVLVANPAVKNLIRENKIYQIDLVIDTSLEEGMISLNRALATLVQQGEISAEKAYEYSLDPVILKKLLEE